MSTEEPRSILFTYRSSKMYVLAVSCFVVYTYTTLYGLASPVLPFAINLIRQGSIPRENLLGGDRYYHGQEVISAGVAKDVGILFASYVFSCSIAAPFLGYFADSTKNKKPPMLLGIVTLLGASLAFLLATDFSHLILARALQGSAGACVWMFTLVLVSDTFSERRRGRQIGTMMMFHDTGMQSGGPIGAFYNILGYKGPFLFPVVMTFFAFILRYSMIDRPSNPQTWPEKEETSNPDKNIKLTIDEADSGVESTFEKCQSDSLKSSSKASRVLPALIHPRVLAALLQTFTIGFSIGAMQLILPPHLISEFGFDPSETGVACLALSIPTILASPLSGFFYDNYGPRILCSTTILVCGLSTILLTLPSGERPSGSLAFFVLMSIYGFTNAFAYIPMFPEMERAIKSLTEDVGSTKGLSYGLACGSWCLGLFTGPYLSGYILTIAGFRWACVVMAVIMLISGPLVLVYSGYSKKKEPPAPVPEPVEYMQISFSNSSNI